MTEGLIEKNIADYVDENEIKTVGEILIASNIE